MTRRKTAGRIRRTGAILFDAAEAILSAGALLLIIGCLYVGIREKMTGEMTFLFGVKPVYIQSGSMEPAIRTGSFVLLEKASAEQIREGDIITFRTADGYVTHRYLGTDEEAKEEGRPAYLITKGDANRVEDPERLAPENVIGIIKGGTD